MGRRRLIEFPRLSIIEYYKELTVSSKFIFLGMLFSACMQAFRFWRDSIPLPFVDVWNFFYMWSVVVTDAFLSIGTLFLFNLFRLHLPEWLMTVLIVYNMIGLCVSASSVLYRSNASKDQHTFSFSPRKFLRYFETVQSRTKNTFLVWGIDILLRLSVMIFWPLFLLGGLTRLVSFDGSYRMAKGKEVSKSLIGIALQVVFVVAVFSGGFFGAGRWLHETYPDGLLKAASSAYVAGDGVRIRRQPFVREGNDISKLQRKSKLKIVYCVPGAWCNIKHNNQSAYICEQFVSNTLVDRTSPAKTSLCETRFSSAKRRN